jgi:hypothetical protein
MLVVLFFITWDLGIDGQSSRLEGYVVRRRALFSILQLTRSLFFFSVAIVALCRFNYYYRIT